MYVWGATVRAAPAVLTAAVACVWGVDACVRVHIQRDAVAVAASVGEFGVSARAWVDARRGEAESALARIARWIREFG